MAVFEYRGLSASGKTVRGIIDATSPDGARERLRSRGIYLQHISEITITKKRLLQPLSLLKKRNQMALLTRQLSFLLGAKLPVIHALEGVIEQMEEGELKKVMVDIKEKIKEGKSVSQAFSDYPDYFNRMYVTTIQAGELSGKLDEVFSKLASMYERNQALIAKLRSVLTYPMIMLVFALIIIVFLVSFIVPTFARLFADFGQTLPLTTRMLIGVSNLISSSWWAIILFLILVFMIIRRAYKSERGKLYFDNLVLKLPVVKKILLDTFRIRFSYTMSIMLSGGTGILDALETTADVFKNSVLRDSIKRAAVLVKKGERLSRALSENPGFNAGILGMIHAGEMGNRLPDVLNSIAHNIEVDLEEKISTLTSLVEPVMIVLIGLIVGFVVLSIMLPIFQINQILG